MMKTLGYEFKKLPRNLLFFSALLLMLLFTAWAHAGQVTLSWEANPEPDLAGYRIHYGTASGVYGVHLDVQKVTTYTVLGLAEGQTYFFAATAYNVDGEESGYSNEVSHFVSAPDAAPETPPPPSGPAAGETTPSSGFTISAADPGGTGTDPNANGTDESSPAPDAPILDSPSNDERVSSLAPLKTGEFISVAAGATHAETRWQVFRDEDDVCVLDIQSPVALTHLIVPKLVLDEGTAYFWRARFIDSDGAVSEWSDYEYFTTVVTERDLNADGILDDQEVDSGEDLDDDGVADRRQATIKSVKMEGTQVQIGVSIKNCLTALAVEAVESEDPRQSDAYASGKPRRMPFGLINFKIAVAAPGDPATVELHFSMPAPARSKWFKYDPTADEWQDFSAYALFAADRRSLTLTLQDGGPGDADGVANGVIVDPAGIVEEADAEIVGADGGAASGGGGGGGCFISAVAPAADAGHVDGRSWLIIGLAAGIWQVLRKRPKRRCF